MPPNSKGGAFIHDPKISGEREVLAQVKLAFLNTNKVQMICTRSMQLTIKKTARTFKTLEGQLLAMKDGERSTVSTRCAELDVQMPIFLGASKAVLDYVIFCHQEDNLWPLSEPSVVKKRFDEIFEATKYTKALDNIKGVRKEYSSDAKLKEKDVQIYKAETERAEEVEKRVESLILDIDRFRQEARELKTEMDKVTQETERLFKSNQQFQEVIYKLEHTRHALAAAEDTLKRRTQEFEELDVSDEELQRMLDNFESDVGNMRDNIQSITRDIEKEKSALQELRDDHQREVREEGQLKAEHDTYLKQRSKLSRFVEEHKEALDGVSTENLEEAAVELKEALERQRDRASAELDKLRLEGTSREAKLNRELQALTRDKLTHEQKRASGRDAIRSAETEIKTLQDEIDSSMTDDGDLEFEKARLAEIENKIAGCESKLASLEQDSGLAEKQQQLSEIEDQVESLNADLARANEQSSERAKLSVLADELARKRTALENLLSANEASFEKAVGKQLVAQTAETVIREVVSSLTSSRETQQSHVDETKRSINEIEARIGIQKDQVEKLKQERWQLKDTIERAIGEEYTQDRYENYMVTLEDELAQTSREVEQSSFAKEFYGAAIDIANSDSHCCVLCERSFDDKQELATFIDSVSEKLERLRNLAESKSELEKRQEYVERARSVAPSINRAGKIDEEVDFLESELADHEDELERVQRTLENHSDKLSEIKTKMDTVEGFRKLASDLARYQREISGLESQVESTKQSLPDIGSGVSVADMHSRLSDLNTQAKTLKASIAETTSTREKLRTELNAQQSALNSKTLEIHRIESTLKEQQTKAKRIEELRQNIVAHQESISVANVDLDRSLESLKSTEKALADAKNEAMAKEREGSSRLSSIVQLISELESLMAAVTEYAGREAQLVDCQRRVASLLSQIESKQAAIDSLGEKLSVADKALLDMRGHERNLRDNHEVRRIRGEIVTMKQTIEELESQHAEQEKESYEQEAARLQQRYVKLNSEYSSRMGEIKQMDDQLARETEELNTRFKDHRGNYRRALISLRATEVANDDLAKYAKALDNAIMTYHSMKMEEINRIIDELWKKTYTGTDVDTILIRSDNENARGNRSYNYRVCMMKQDVELDMRGRCSAGQKVLASIIIRLALAECFGKNCGVIALDEPTTNLDQDNIESLAQSLGAIIESRRVQKNFQLIVITHDEHFLRHMNAAAYTDHFFRITRNPHQLSKISVVPISRVTE